MRATLRPAASSSDASTTSVGRDEAHRGADERERGDADPDGEDDVEGVCQQRPHRRGSAGPGQQERPASRGSAVASSWRATSAGRADAAPACRRAKRTCVESVRCARLAKTANARRDRRDAHRSAEAKYAVRIGNAPQASAGKMSSETHHRRARGCTRPRWAPAATNTRSHQVERDATTIPIAHAAPIETAASTPSRHRDPRLERTATARRARGRRPRARSASTVRPSTPTSSVGRRRTDCDVRQMPEVYGACSRVT